uniref:Uncharacterized protein n=1 Tax=viral metagenome TaxID=1070528 RepID=A0A6M3LUI3_9ZZZZ
MTRVAQNTAPGGVFCALCAPRQGLTPSEALKSAPCKSESNARKNVVLHAADLPWVWSRRRYVLRCASNIDIVISGDEGKWYWAIMQGGVTTYAARKPTTTLDVGRVKSLRKLKKMLDLPINAPYSAVMATKRAKRLRKSSKKHPRTQNPYLKDAL